MGRVNNPTIEVELENVIPDELHLMYTCFDIQSDNVAAVYDARNVRHKNEILNKQ